MKKKKTTTSGTRQGEPRLENSNISHRLWIIFRSLWSNYVCRAFSVIDYRGIRKKTCSTWRSRINNKVWDDKSHIHIYTFNNIWSCFITELLNKHSVFMCGTLHRSSKYVNNLYVKYRYYARSKTKTNNTDSSHFSTSVLWSDQPSRAT